MGDGFTVPLSSDTYDGNAGARQDCNVTTLTQDLDHRCQTVGERRTRSFGVQAKGRPEWWCRRWFLQDGGARLLASGR